MLTRRQCPPTQCSVNIDSHILETSEAKSVLCIKRLAMAAAMSWSSMDVVSAQFHARRKVFHFTSFKLLKCI